uniref:PGG domain-containing protein n=1 Tax=Oryza punctata TaxID=4537 RepID=A0A0E0MD74_ORYPU
MMPMANDDAQHAQWVWNNGMGNLEGASSFKCFTVFDNIVVTTSVVAVILLVYRKASRSIGLWKSFMVVLHCIWVSHVNLIVAFYSTFRAMIISNSSPFKQEMHRKLPIDGGVPSSPRHSQELSPAVDRFVYLAQGELEQGIVIPVGIEFGAIHQRPRVVHCLRQP